jgi:hypothetical protein
MTIKVTVKAMICFLHYKRSRAFTISKNDRRIIINFFWLIQNSAYCWNICYLCIPWTCKSCCTLHQNSSILLQYCIGNVTRYFSIKLPMNKSILQLIAQQL